MPTAPGTPVTFPQAPPRYLDDGQGVRLLQAENQAGAITAATTTQAAVVTTAAALTSYGYTEAQANALVAAVNAGRVDQLANVVAINAIISALEAAGIVVAN